MSKQVIRNYIFDATAKTITLPDLDAVDLGRLVLVTNVTRGVIIYNFADPAKGATVASNVITLLGSLAGMSSSDVLRVDYDTAYGDTSYDRITIGNSRNKFRDGFASSGVQQPNPSVWDLQSDDAGHIITQGGDSFGSSYLRISLSPFVDNSGVTLTSKRAFKFPMRVGYGISTSQRILGQEVFFGMAGTDSSGNLDITSMPADLSITGTTATVSSNIATFTIAGHGLKGGDRVEVEMCPDKRLNVGPVPVTVVDYNTISVSCTLGNGTYSTVGGYVRNLDPFRGIKNGAGLLLENTSTTNGSFVARRNGAKFRLLNSTIGTTQATQSNTNAYTDAFNSATAQELYFSLDEVLYRSYASDSTAGTSGLGKFTQGIPDEDLDYKIHFRARNLTGMTAPVARIATIAKTGTTTATVTTTAPHGLAVTDFVQIYGVADQTNYPNLTGQTQVSSVVNATTFTIVIGTATTTSSTGGAVWQVQGSVLAPGVFSQVVQSISQTSQVLTVIGNGPWSTPLPGEFLQLHGMTGAAAAYDGAYKVLRVSGTTLELQGSGTDFTSITTGGAAMRRTDVRLHFTRVMDYTRLVTEISGGKGNTSDVNNSVPVAITGSASLAVSQTTGTNATQWNAAGWAGSMVADVASAAVTSTQTTSAVAPGLVNNVGAYAHSFNVIVTAVSGTTPTMDVGVEESLDNGTNWVRVYDFPRITANGAYTSPLIRAQYGTRYRYVQTVGGTTPSFTRAINRVMFSAPGQLARQFFDRSIVLTTLNSTTPTYTVDGCTFFQISTNLGAATTAPVLQLQGSEDGTNWYSVGTTFTPVASSTTVSVTKDVAPKFVRVLVQTAGATVTAGYISIKALGT